MPSATSLEDATQVVRGNWLQAIEDHHKKYSGCLGIADIIDVGRFVGVSTRFLADKFPLANVIVSTISAFDF